MGTAGLWDYADELIADLEKQLFAYSEKLAKRRAKRKRNRDRRKG